MIASANENRRRAVLDINRMTTTGRHPHVGAAVLPRINDTLHQDTRQVVPSSWASAPVAWQTVLGRDFYGMATRFATDRVIS